MPTELSKMAQYFYRILQLHSYHWNSGNRSGLSAELTTGRRHSRALGSCGDNHQMWRSRRSNTWGKRPERHYLPRLERVWEESTG